MALGLKRCVAAAAAAAALAVATIGVCACASPVYVGIPLAPGAADAELQSLARQAEAGDKPAQLELATRFEDGRGLKADPVRAEALYRKLLKSGGFQTQFIPSANGASPENTAIGDIALWPRSFEGLADYDGIHAIALLRWCRLRSSKAAAGSCPGDQVDLLMHLVQFEAYFHDCRLATKLGNAGPDPHAFLFNAVDVDRHFATRTCMLERPLPTHLAQDRARIVWDLWLAVAQQDRCGTAACRARTKAALVRTLPATIDDSLVFFAVRDALGREPPIPDQVGSSWWSWMCRLLDTGPGGPPLRFETKICGLIRDLNKEEA